MHDTVNWMVVGVLFRKKVPFIFIIIIRGLFDHVNTTALKDTVTL